MKWFLCSLLLLPLPGFAQDAPKLESLFNGKDLTGWQKPARPECWTVKEGVLHLANNPKKQGDILRTEKRFTDFVCELEFQFGEGTIDSGIFLRNDREQIQIGISGSLKRDMTASPYIPGKGYPVEALKTPERKKLLKAKGWNTLRIRAIGNQYTTWLNGEEVMNYTSASAAKEGPLGIQLHGNREMSISFRNLRAAALKGAKAPAPEPPKKKTGLVPNKASKIKTVSASGAQDGNPAPHAVDGNPGTRWSNLGKGSWLQLDFDGPQSFDRIGVGFRNGKGRHYKLVFQISPDGRRWSNTADVTSNGRSDAVEFFALGQSVNTAHLRIVANGSQANDWINIHTLVLPGVHEGRADVPAIQRPSIDGAGGLTMTLWAENPLVASPVGISFDHQGAAYVTRVRRRKRLSLDLRQHRDWVKQDMAIQSVADKLAFYRAVIEGTPPDGIRRWQPADFNKDGVRNLADLAGESEEIYKVADTDGDGLADKMTVVDDRLASPVTGIAAGTLWHRGELFAAVEPDIWRYRDSDGDGVLDQRDLIATGFSIHIGQGGHNMSGLAIGPDGRLYWSVADKGINATGSDGSEVFLPNRGGVMRCELDGSDLTCFAPGVRNGQELAFDAFGDLFTVDNDGDYPGERERLLHVVEGAETGWRLNWQWHGHQAFAKVSGQKPYNVWMQEKLAVPRWKGQAAYILPPIQNVSNGPCGFKANPGTALSERYRDHFFIAYGREVKAFRLEADGASYKMVGEHSVAKGPHATGLAFDPSGALYVCDWMNGPSERGRVWKIDDASAVDRPARIETRQLLEQGMAKREVTELSSLLGHADQRVRLEAQFELAARGEAETLRAAVKQTEHRLARLHGTWGLGQLGRKSAAAVRPLLAFTGDPDAEVRRQVARVLGDAALSDAATPLIQALHDPEIRVRVQAALALGKLKVPSSVAPLFAEVAANEDEDATYRHALVMGLSTATPETLAAAAKHESAAVRLAAVLALRRQADPAISAFLEDYDPYILAEAARAIHDDLSIPAALPALAEALDRTDLVGEPLLRRAINANFRVGRPADAERLARYAARSDAPEAMRATALACLALWARPPLLDAVEGRARRLAPRDPGVAAKALSAVAAELASDGSETVRTVLARAIDRLQSRELLPLVHAMYPDADPGLRAQLLDTMHGLADPALGEFVKQGLKDSSEAVRTRAQRLAAFAGVSGLELSKRLLADGSLAEQRAAIESLRDLKTAEADTILRGKLKAAPPELLLDLVLAARSRPALQDTLKALEDAQATSGTLGPHLATMAGGDADIGKQIARGHAAAQCIRCHKIGSVGGALGPDLSTIAARLSPEQLLRSLVDPGAELADGFGLLQATLKDGQTVTGTVRKQTSDHYLLELPEGGSRKVPRSAIVSEILASSMPPMGAILEPRELRDLMAYLQTLQ